MTDGVRGRAGTILVAALAIGAGVAGLVTAIRVRRHLLTPRDVPGGRLITNPAAYDALTHRLLFRSFFSGIAADVATGAPDGATILEVGCGPGHLANLMAGKYGLDVTGLDLDPDMIELARANAERQLVGERRPSFVVGDVAALPFPDATFDRVVSTLSMHHWADPVAGSAEIGRVLKPGGRALIWDFRRGGVPFHRDVPDPVHLLGGAGAPLRMISATAWRWPWIFKLAQRIELVAEPVTPA